jgi:predicted nucleic acid-binding Zn ribbon protein
MQTFKCPFCEKKYVQKPSLYTHMETEHHAQLNNLPPAQVYFNIKNKKTHGTCIMCKKETKFNLNTEKYDRICSEKCKEAYSKMFKQRMLKTYGRTTLLND